MSHVLFKRIGLGKVGIDPTEVASFEDGFYTRADDDVVPCVWIRFKREGHKAVAVEPNAESVAKSLNMKPDRKETT